MTILSKIINPRNLKILGGSSVLLLIFLFIKLKRKIRKNHTTLGEKEVSKERILVNLTFLRNLWKMIKICFFENGVPKFFVIFNGFLVVRTLFSIYISTYKGKVVKGIVSSNIGSFIKNIFSLALISVPASFVNSYLDYLQKLLSLKLKKGIMYQLNSKYLSNKVFYQVMNVDSRIENPDQILTDDLTHWSESLTEAYSGVSKPILDIILFYQKLTQRMDWRAPLVMILWFLFSGWVLKKISPAYGKITAEKLRREGIFRAEHQRIVGHSEEIAFLRGDLTEKVNLNSKLKNLMKIYRYDNFLKFFTGIADSMLIKYGAFNIGFSILAFPVFGPGREAYMNSINNDASNIMRDYESNSVLLINLAKAVGKIVSSFKSIQTLAGTTHRVNNLLEVLDDIRQKGIYKKQIVNNKELIYDPELNGNNLNKGKLWISKDFIKLEEVPIIAPNGDFLIDKLTLKFKTGMNCVVYGPNGSGKTSFLRVLSGLWPFFSGKISKVQNESIMFLPQRAYLTRTTLRDQIIYPDLKSKKSDYELKLLLEKVNLGYLLEREGSWDKENEWVDVLSGGERQRLSIARLLYHSPMFACLDEATSAVSVDIENSLYVAAKKQGITLITVTQRNSLFNFHDYALKFTGNGDWTFELIQDNIS